VIKVFCACVRIVWKGFDVKSGLARMRGCRKRSNSNSRFLCAFESVDEVPLPILPILELALGFTSPECIGIEDEGFSVEFDSGGTISSSREARAVWRSSIFPTSCSFAFRFIRRSCDLEKCVVLGPNFCIKASRLSICFPFLLRPTGSDVVCIGTSATNGMGRSSVTLLAPLSNFIEG